MLVLASASPRRRELLTQAGFSFTVHPAHIPEDPFPNEDPIAYVTRLARQKAEAAFRELLSTALPFPQMMGAPGPDSRTWDTTNPDPGSASPPQILGAPSISRILRNGWEATDPNPAPAPSPQLMGAPGLELETWEATKASASEKRASAARQVPSAPPQVVVLGADTTVTLDNHILGKPDSPADAARMLRLLSGRTHHVITGVALVTEQSTQVAAEVTAVRFLTLSEEDIAAYVATGEPMDKAGAYAIQGYAARWIPRIEGCYFNVVGLPIALVTTLLELL